uniref:Uncharacterized protein n=1 Tax=Zea mays TaxID=4577 RepID=B4FLV8_MAIZE|nr:unknown [Zea mays]
MDPVPDRLERFSLFTSGVYKLPVNH